jgi:hypothetical protein
MGYGAFYLDWLCLAVLAVVGVGVALGHKPTMRLALVALAVLIGAAVVPLPGNIALAAGWVKIDYSHVDWAAAFHVSPQLLKQGEAEVERVAGMDLWRVAAILALLNTIGGIILKVGAFVWLRRIGRQTGT